MTDLFEMRNAAVKLASKKYVPEMAEPKYSNLGSIYIASTSNVKDTLSLYSGYKRVLAVGATGAHAYEAILNGAEEVDMFDINELQKLFYEYMQTAIICLPYEMFIKNFTLSKNSERWTREELSNFFSKEMFFILEPYLSEEITEVFGPLIMFYDGPELLMSSLFRFEHPIGIDYLKRFISFYNKEEYNKLQLILREGKVKLNYKCCSLDDVPDNFKGPYDLIILDNVLQYYKKMRGLETPYNVNMFISKKLAPMLSDTGAIQATYGFEVATDALKHALHLPISSASNNPIIRFGLSIEEKEGIHYQLLRKWDTYSYNFIPPVEEDFKDTENVVLTYRPRKK